MAHELNYFFDCAGHSSSEGLLATVLEGLVNSGLEGPNLVNVRRSTDWPQAFGDWISGELTVAGRDIGVAVEIHADAESAELAWADLTGDSDVLPIRPGDHLATCALTLVGEVDWPVVELIRTFLREHLRAVEHDETDGFTTA